MFISRLSEMVRLRSLNEVRKRFNNRVRAQRMSGMFAIAERNGHHRHARGFRRGHIRGAVADHDGALWSRSKHLHRAQKVAGVGLADWQAVAACDDAPRSGTPLSTIPQLKFGLKKEK